MSPQTTRPESFVLVPRSILRFSIFFASLLLFLVLFSTGSRIEVSFAQGGSTDDTDESEAGAEYFIRNPNFEDPTISPWVKRPATSPDHIALETCCANALPLSGGKNVALYPASGDVTIQQTVNVYGGWKYFLSTWVASNGTRAELIWWNNGDKINRTCANITRQWPDYRSERCEFVVPTNATKVRVKLKAIHTNSSNWVVTDGWVLTSKGHFYAQALKTGSFYGVWAKINTVNPSPKIREPIFYYATMNLVNTQTNKGLETGWIVGTNSSCQNRFGYSTSVEHWENQTVTNPLPAANTTYQFWLYRVQGNTWRVDITDLQGYIIFRRDLPISGLDVGTRLLVGGEVFSPHRINDMGINNFLEMKWMDQNGYWYPWNGFTESKDTPYSIAYHPYDPNNSIQVSGNKGANLAPGSPCP